MPGTRVFIGRLSDRVRESDIDRFFRDIGKVRDVHLKAGFGFVDFNDPRDADDAVYEMNNKELCGERVTVEMARDHREPRYGRGGGGRGGGGYRGDSYRSGGGFRGGGRFGGGGRPAVIRSKYRVIVENLSSRVSWQDLKSHFRQYAQVVFADINRHRQNEGVVDFATRDDMERAIDKLDQTELNGRVMDLIEDKPPRSPSRRSRSRSRNSRRSRSRSSSRSRSRSRTPERRRSEKSSNGTRERRESKSSPSRRSSPSRSKRSPAPPSKRREASSPEHKRRSVSPKRKSDSPAKRGRNGDGGRDEASSRSRSRSLRSRSRDSTPPRRRRS